MHFTIGKKVVKDFIELIKTNAMHYPQRIAVIDGERKISYADFSLYLTQAIDIQKNYLDKLNEYNHSVIQLYYFTNK